jgi:hypothetical protein
MGTPFCSFELKNRQCSNLRVEKGIKLLLCYNQK